VIKFLAIIKRLFDQNPASIVVVENMDWTVHIDIFNGLVDFTYPQLILVRRLQSEVLDSPCTVISGVYPSRVVMISQLQQCLSSFHDGTEFPAPR
jgi:hypothetical protein